MRLAILLYGRQAGFVVREGGKIWLEYDEDYAADPDATPLSLSMPLSKQRHTQRPVAAFLRGLLPDHADIRERWARSFGLRGGDTLGLIGAIGTDVAGGALFVPIQRVEEALARPGQVTPVSDTQIGQHLRLLRTDQLAWHSNEDEHWSLAGGQSKFTLAKTADGRWGTPSGSAPSTHIVKPGISRIPAQALTEHLSMRALALIGEDAAATKYVEFDGEPAIVIRRFDRINSADGSVLRVHTEDLAQAHAVMPERKYESDRGPGVQIIANTLRSAAGDSTVAKFARGVIANYLLAAPDAHSKNYSLLLAGRNVELAPLYDVASGLAGDPGTGALRWRKSAMSIGGENRFGEVVGKNWAKFATILDMDSSLIVDYVKEMSSTIPDAFGQAIRELPPNTPGIDLAKKLILPRLSSYAAHVHKQSDRTEHARRTRTTFFDTLQAPTPAQPVSAQSSAPPDKSR